MKTDHTLISKLLRVSLLIQTFGQLHHAYTGSFSISIFNNYNFRFVRIQSVPTISVHQWIQDHLVRVSTSCTLVISNKEQPTSGC